MCRQYRRKENIQFSSDKTKVRYTQRQHYVFDKKSSAPLSEDDEIVVLNTHMNVSFYFIR